MRRAGLPGALALLVPLALGACGGAQPPEERGPVAVPPEAACHVCGMILGRFPGPKGEAYVETAQRPLFFCSTLELLVWLRQPDVTARVRGAWVHDMGGAAWERPDDARWVRAEEAWYVAGHALPGAMGPTLASFARREDAERFAREHGGEVLPYGRITLELLGSLRPPPGAGGGPPPKSP